MYILHPIEHKGLIEGELFIGIDEVGRGSLAGPIVAGVVVIDTSFLHSAQKDSPTITDSKKLTAPKREEATRWIKKHALFSACIAISAKEIDAIGIQEANKRVIEIAISRALSNVPNTTSHILLDYFPLKVFKDKPVYPLKKGDQRSLAIASASIVAKVARDRLMNDLSEKYTEYEWESNVGYGTLKHREALKKYGLSPEHRKTFCKAYV